MQHQETLTGSAQNGAWQRVLVVAEDALVAAALGMIVEGYGAEVVGPIAAASISQVAAAAAGVDAVLLDVDAGEASAQIAGMLRRRNVPFVLATDVSEQLAASSSGRAIIARPYRTDDVTEALRRIGLAAATVQ